MVLFATNSGFEDCSLHLFGATKPSIFDYYDMNFYCSVGNEKDILSLVVSAIIFKPLTVWHTKKRFSIKCYDWKIKSSNDTESRILLIANSRKRLENKYL